LGAGFELTGSRRHDHSTPWNSSQRFLFCVFRRNAWAYHDATWIDDHLSTVSTSIAGDDANRCMSIFLRLQGLWRSPETKAGRLLRVLLLRFGPMSADSGGQFLLRVTQCRHDRTDASILSSWRAREFMPENVNSLLGQSKASEMRA